MKLDLPASLLLIATMLILLGCIYLKVDGAATALLGIAAAVALYFQHKGITKSVPPPPPSNPYPMPDIPKDRPTKPGGEL